MSCAEVAKVEKFEEELVCPHCGRNEKQCEEQTDNEKNPITEWCGWGLSCDDCYYENHPEEEDEEDEDCDDHCKTCGLRLYDILLTNKEKHGDWCHCNDEEEEDDDINEPC